MIQRNHFPTPAGPFILAFGDSLTAGYGLRRDDAFPAVLERGLQARFAGASVHNAGVSGDTTSGGRARLPRVLAALPRAPHLAIVELGANDFIRNVDPARTADQLDAILATLRDCRIPVLLAGMQAPAILGERALRFNAIYPALAARHAVALDPFFLHGVAGRQGYVLADGFHPNAAGIAHVAARILPQVEALLAEQVGRLEMVGGQGLW
jgi:acyl-CoA thioesterase-1